MLDREKLDRQNLAPTVFAPTSLSIRSIRLAVGSLFVQRAREAAVSEWQPIATAPTDGTFVLLYFPGEEEGRYRVGFWGDPPDWYESECSSHAMTEFGREPTHWKPLAPPE
jgi:hypothetical protein